MCCNKIRSNFGSLETHLLHPCCYTFYGISSINRPSCITGWRLWIDTPCFDPQSHYCAKAAYDEGVPIVLAWKASRSSSWHQYAALEARLSCGVGLKTYHKRGKCLGKADVNWPLRWAQSSKTWLCWWIGTETCEVGNVFSPDDLWIGLNTYTNYALIYHLHS